MQYPGFIAGTYELQSIMAGVARTINLMPESMEKPGGKSEAVLNGTPGLVLWATVGSGPIKLLDGTPSSHTVSPGVDVNFIHAISGNQIYRVKWSDGTSPTSIGSALSAAGGAPGPYLANGFFGLSLIVAGGVAYSLNKPTDTLAAVAGLSGTYCYGAAWVDGYFFTSDGNKVFYSVPGDPTTFNALDFFTPAIDTDSVANLGAKHGILWIFKDRSIEPYYNSGDSLDPWQRIDGASISFGAGGADLSIAKLDQSWIFMGMDLNGAGVIYQVTNFAPVRISDYSIENAIRNMSNAGGAIAWSFLLKGHYIYVISFPNASVPQTWAYDTYTKHWFEWEYWNGATFACHLGRCCTVGSDWLTGSRIDGKIYKIRSDAYLDDTAVVRRLRRAPHVNSEGKVITYTKFQLDMEPGLVAPAADDQVYMRYSNDGGKTFTTAEGTSLGFTSGGTTTKTRAIWRRLGAARDRVFEVYSDAAIKHCWTDAFLNNID